MAKKLQELLVEIATKSNQQNEIFDAADKRGDGVNTKEEMAQIKSLEQEIVELQSQATDLKEMDDIRSGNGSRIKSLSEPQRTVPFANGVNAESGGHPPSFKSVGEMVIEQKDMSAWLKQYEGRAPISQQTVQSPRVPAPYLFDHQNANSVKTLVTGLSDTSGGAFVQNDRKPIVDSFYERPLTIRDLITIGQTDSDTVDYVRIGPVTNNAAPVAEATATTGTSGTKPESALATARVSEVVRTIAHWIPATNRALADSGQMRTLIDNFLRYGLDEEVEDQIVAGAGTGENFTGVLNTSGTTAQAFATDVLKTTRMGRTKVRTAGRARPTAYVMNPLDWQDIDLMRVDGSTGAYIYGGPKEVGQPRLWGLPVVESEAMPVGTAVVADWRMAVLWDRMLTAISMTNSHADFFVRNMVAILAELRAAFGLIRPSAFVICDLTAA